MLGDTKRAYSNMMYCYVKICNDRCYIVKFVKKKMYDVLGIIM